jgi:hypothetical protein
MGPSTGLIPTFLFSVFRGRPNIVVYFLIQFTIYTLLVGFLFVYARLSGGVLKDDFLNPAGHILVALFRAYSWLGVGFILYTYPWTILQLLYWLLIAVVAAIASLVIALGLFLEHVAWRLTNAFFLGRRTISNTLGHDPTRNLKVIGSRKRSGNARFDSRQRVTRFSCPAVI